MQVFIVYWSFYAPNVTTGGAVIGLKEITKCEIFKNEKQAEKFVEKLNDAILTLGVSVQVKVETKTL